MTQIDFKDRLSDIADALRNPARISILELLSSHAQSCGELTSKLPLAQATVSQHLSVLSEAGLIQGRPQGTKVIYQLNATGIREMKRVFGELIREIPNSTPSIG